VFSHLCTQAGIVLSRNFAFQLVVGSSAHTIRSRRSEDPHHAAFSPQMPHFLRAGRVVGFVSGMGFVLVSMMIAVYQLSPYQNSVYRMLVPLS
jgi:hypothetical protein